MFCPYGRFVSGRFVWAPNKHGDMAQSSDMQHWHQNEHAKWTCSMNKQHRQTAIFHFMLILFFMFIFCLCSFFVYVHVHVQFTQHVIQLIHATCSCSIDTLREDVEMKMGKAVWTCGMETWTWSTDMKFGHAALACGMGIQNRYAAWTSRMDVQHLFLYSFTFLF
jgi:hypothetical protein